MVEPGGPAYQPLIDRFGPGILDADGPHRPARSWPSMVFGHPEALADLNAITHPAIGVGHDRGQGRATPGTDESWSWTSRSSRPSTARRWPWPR